MTKFIEPYNPRWKAEFENMERLLRVALHDLIMDIQHVGSTAVPGLLAKPVLDIDIIIEDKTLLPAIIQRLDKLGYLFNGDQGIPGRFAFRQTAETVPFSGKEHKWQQHHLYVCYSDSLALKNHLLLRNALRENKELANDYSKLKQSLVDNGITREEYTSGKTAFILYVLEREGLSNAELQEISDANT